MCGGKITAGCMSGWKENSERVLADIQHGRFGLRDLDLRVRLWVARWEREAGSEAQLESSWC